MKQYTLSTTAATLAALLLVMPAHSQEEPQPGSENAGMSAEGPSQAEQGSQGPQEEASQADAQEAGADAGLDAAGDSDEPQSGNSQNSADQNAEGQSGDAQNAEEENYEEALRGLTWERRFHEVDANRNSAAEWDEIAQTYENELTQAGWNERDAFEQFDVDQDGRLDHTEYMFFLSSLQQELSGNEAEQGAQS